MSADLTWSARLKMNRQKYTPLYEKGTKQIHNRPMETALYQSKQVSKKLRLTFWGKI